MSDASDRGIGEAPEAAGDEELEDLDQEFWLAWKQELEAEDPHWTRTTEEDEWSIVLYSSTPPETEYDMEGT
eukprot:4239292-Pyramimonas_sp.AAC.1